MREARRIVNQESAQYNIDHSDNSRDQAPTPTQEQDQRSEETVKEELKKDGKETNIHSSEAEKPNGANSDEIVMPDAEPSGQGSAPRDTGDDGGEVVEGDEDIVIY